MALVPDLPRDDQAASPVGSARADGEPSAGGPMRVDDRWDLEALAALVEERAADFPDRVEEWRAYIVYLRDFVGDDRLLPAAFDGLVVDVFGGLLELHDRA